MRPPPRPLRALGLGAVGLVLLGAATLLDEWLPDDRGELGNEPFVRTAGVGEPVELREVSVEVETVQGARSVDEFGRSQVSPGVWVVVQYAVTPAAETTALDAAELRDGSGRVWSASHGRSSNVCLDGPPGVRIGCVAWFEVPVDAVATLRLRLAPALEQRYDLVADVDLGLTDADAEAFSATTGLEIPGTTLGGR